MGEVDTGYGYPHMLTLAGADVHFYEEDGDYQGDWVAKVTWNGTTGWVAGGYGSCSGCDEYQSITDWGNSKEDVKKELIEAGRMLLGGIRTAEETITGLDAGWYGDLREVIKREEGI